MRHQSLLALGCALSLAGSTACTTRGHDDDAGGGSRDTGGTGDVRGGGDAGGIGSDALGGSDACASSGTTAIQCTSIYTITGGAGTPQLYRFDPVCLTFNLIGPVNCGEPVKS